MSACSRRRNHCIIVCFEKADTIHEQLRYAFESISRYGLAIDSSQREPLLYGQPTPKGESIVQRRFRNSGNPSTMSYYALYVRYFSGDQRD